MGGVGLHEQLVTAFGLDEVLEAAVRGGLDVPGEAGFISKVFNWKEEYTVPSSAATANWCD